MARKERKSYDNPELLLSPHLITKLKGESTSKI